MTKEININYSKLYSRWLDNVNDISIRSSWGLNVGECVKNKKMLRGSKLEAYQSIQVDQAAKNIMIKEDQVFKPE